MPLASYSTCEISDALIKLGVANGGYIPDIEMISPSRDDASIRICGPAYTVKMVHADSVDAPTPSSHFVDATPEGHIIVISAPSDLVSAVWGGLMTAGAQAHNAPGVIVDGRCRDLAEHRAASFPVFARGHSTLGQGKFSRPSELNVPIEIWPSNRQPRSVPVPVSPGDTIVADIDGVVCVPASLVESVIQKCRQLREIDDKCVADIKAGKGIEETFKKWRG